MTREKKILIVDDNIDFCRNITDILEMKGYRVTSVHDGFRALETLQADEFDAVLMDIKMPLMDGVETFRRLKKIRPGMVVIMITAFAVEDLIKEALREGAFGTFHKPIDFEKLLSTVENSFEEGALIMVVDDDRALCSNIHDVLGTKGYRIRIAEDGERALQLAMENKYDIMLLDMKLPAMNGFQTFLNIMDIRPNIVTILITGYPDEMKEFSEQAIKRNAIVCLEKPLDMNNLLKLLEKVNQAKISGMPLKKPGNKEDIS